MEQNEKKHAGIIGPIVLCLLTLAADAVYFYQYFQEKKLDDHTVSFNDAAFTRMEYMNIGGSALVVSGAALLMSRYNRKKGARLGGILMIACGLAMVVRFFMYAWA
jgi:hypothetical protein